MELQQADHSRRQQRHPEYEYADLFHLRPSDSANYLDGDWIFDPSIASMRPRILTLNDLAPSTNSIRTVRDEVGTIRVLDGPGNRITLSYGGPV